MSTNDNNDLEGCLMIVAMIVLPILSGYISWNWIEPESFLGAILFMTVWGIIWKALHFVLFLIVASINRD